MTRRFDLIAFDWDGTLFNSTAAITLSIQDAVRDLGFEPPSNERASYVIGMALGAALAHAAPHVPEPLRPELSRRYTQHYLRRQQELTLFDGALALLHALKSSGHLIAVATGKSRVGLNNVLEHVDLKGMFDATRTADETASKPAPLMLQELMAQLDVSAERTLMIGDTTHDLQMALNAGCPSVGVAWGAHPLEMLTPLKPDFMAHTMDELHGWLLGK